MVRPSLHADRPHCKFQLHTRPFAAAAKVQQATAEQVCQRAAKRLHLSCMQDVIQYGSQPDEARRSASIQHSAAALPMLHTVVRLLRPTADALSPFGARSTCTPLCPARYASGGGDSSRQAARQAALLPLHGSRCFQDRCCHGCASACVHAFRQLLSGESGGGDQEASRGCQS